MPFVYPVVVGLTLITGCANNSAQLRQALHEQQQQRALPVVTAFAAPKKVAPEKRKSQHAKKNARKPRERRNVWVPERLRGAHYGSY